MRLARRDHDADLALGVRTPLLRTRATTRDSRFSTLRAGGDGIETSPFHEPAAGASPRDTRGHPNQPGTSVRPRQAGERTVETPTALHPCAVTASNRQGASSRFGGQPQVGRPRPAGSDSRPTTTRASGPPRPTCTTISVTHPRPRRHAGPARLRSADSGLATASRRARGPVRAWPRPSRPPEARHHRSSDHRPAPAAGTASAVGSHRWSRPQRTGTTRQRRSCTAHSAASRSGWVSAIAAEASASTSRTKSP